MRQTIVLVDSKSEELIKVLTDLSERGMLNPVLISDISGACQVLDEGKLEKIDAFEFMAGLRLELVRFINVSLVGKAPSSEVQKFVEQIQRLLQPGGIELDRYSVVVPKSNQKIDENAFCRYWNYNILVEPADMAGESGFAQVPIDTDKKQAVIAASMVCLLGALWKWLDEGPLDRNRVRGVVGDVSPFDDDGFGPRIRVLRLVTRVVDAGNVTMQAVARALGPGVQLPPPAGCTRHGDPHAFVSSVAKTIFEESDPYGLGLSYRVFPMTPPEEVTKIGPIAAIKLFFVEVGRVLSRMPAEFVDRKTAAITRRIEDFVTNQTFGVDSRLIISVDETGQEQSTYDPTLQSTEFANHSAGPESSIPPSPQTWVRLLNLSFALVDGNELHGIRNFQSPSWEGHPSVVTDSAIMAPSQLLDVGQGRIQIDDQEYQLLGINSDKLGLRLFDSAGASEISRLIDLRLAKDDGRRSSNTQSKDNKIPDQSSTEESDEQRIKAQEKLINAAERKKLEDLKLRLGKATKSVEQTFLGKIATGIEGQIHRARQDCEISDSALRDSLDSLKNSNNESVKAARKYRKRLLVVVLILIASIFGGTLGLLVLPVLSLVIGIGFFALGLFASVAVIIRAAKERVRDQYKAKLISNSLEQAFAKRHHSLLETHRLNSLYVQYLDWAEIIGTVILRPLGSVSVASEAPWGSTSGALSLVSGVPVISDSRSRSLTLSVMQYLVSRGWLTRSYLDRRNRILSGYNDQLELTPGSIGSPEADHSLNQDALFILPSDGGGSDLAVFPPRRTLKQAILEGAYTRQIREEQVARMNKTGLAQNQVLIVDSVKCEVPGLNTPPRSVEEFLTPIISWNQVPDFAEMLTAERAVSGIDVVSFVGASEALDFRGRVENQFVIPIASLEDRYTLAAFRLDISAPLKPNEIAIITPVTVDEPGKVPAGENEILSEDDPLG